MRPGKLAVGARLEYTAHHVLYPTGRAMKFQACADVHGAFEALQQRTVPELPLLLLGDNLNLMDFNTLEGIVQEVVPAEDIARVLKTFATSGATVALDVAREVFFDHPDRQAKARDCCARDYRAMLSRLPQDSKVLYGNVDYPEILWDVLPASMRLDDGFHDWHGLRLAVVNGTPPYPHSMGLPGQRTKEDYDRCVRELSGHVDVLCSHFPPALPGAGFDVLVKRDEGASPTLAEYIETHQPTLHVYGHIHNPDKVETALGTTRVVNVGGFRYRPIVHVFDIEPKGT